MLWIGESSNQWPALAADYLAAISNRMELSPALRDQARHLTGAAGDDDARIGLLARFVQTNCTYKGIEFGRRARIPNTPSDIARNKYGDCKDHALLLQQMLCSVGVPARLALVNARNPIRQELPSLEIRTEEGRIHLEFECRQPTGKFGASDYAAYRETMNLALSVLERELVLKPQPH